jgi:hypothetical protein
MKNSTKADVLDMLKYVKQMIDKESGLNISGINWNPVFSGCDDLDPIGIDIDKLSAYVDEEIDAEPKEKRMNMMANFGADKFMERMFRKADGVVWDLMTGKVGIKTKDGSIATLSGQGDDAQVEINLMDQFGMEIPAFAQNTPIANVNIGDVIYFGATEKPGWVVERRYGVKPIGSTTPAKKTAKAALADDTVSEDAIDKSNVQFTLMKVDGQRTTWKPPKVTMLGMGDNGVMVLRSLMSMLPGGSAGLQGMQNMMMPMMMMGGEGMDFEKIMPLMLMGQMQSTTVQNPDGTVVATQNPMAQMLPMMMMMQMMKGGDSPFAAKKNPGTSVDKGPFFNR